MKRTKDIPLEQSTRRAIAGFGSCLAALPPEADLDRDAVARHLATGEPLILPSSPPPRRQRRKPKHPY